MTFNFAQVFELFLYLILFILLYSIIFRRLYSSVFDPFFFNIVGYLTFTSVAFIFFQGVNSKYLITYFAYCAAFVIGLLISQKFRTKIYKPESVYFGESSKKLLFLVVLLIFFVVFLSNLYLYSKVGITLFSDNPTVSKVSSFSSGSVSGFFRRINWGMLVLGLSGAITLYALNYKRRLIVPMLTIFVMILTFSGSKSALLVVVFYGFIIFNHSSFKNSESTLSFNRLLPVFILIAFTIVLFILSRSNPGAIFESFLFRLLAYGDINIYYFDKDVYQNFLSYNPVNFISDVLNPFLGMLRLTPYSNPLGYEMVLIYNNYDLPFDEILGPNLPVMIVADIYFGKFFGLFYAFFIGSAIGILKNSFERERSNALKLAVKSNLYMFSFALAVDAQMIVGRFFDYFLLLFPIVVVAYLILQSSQTRRMKYVA